MSILKDLMGYMFLPLCNLNYFIRVEHNNVGKFLPSV